MLAPVLSARGIVAARGQSCVLGGVDFDLMPGEMVSIEGASGTGKSTLLHVLAGLLRADFGTVCVRGKPIERFDVERRARLVSIALQSPVLPSALSVTELVRLGRLPYRTRVGWLSRFWRSGERAETPTRVSISESVIVERAIAAVGLHGLASRPLGTLSGGEQRRAHIARVLAQQTPVLLLDEPTTHLDELSSRQVLRELQRRASRGTAVVLVTHNTAWVHRHCTRNLRLENGNLLLVPLRPKNGSQEHSVGQLREGLGNE